MLIDVETLFLDSLIDSQTRNLLDSEEQDYTGNGCPCVDGENTKALCPEESETATIECTAVKGEQTSEDGAENTADTVYRTCTDGVVNVKFGVDELDREYQYYTSGQTDDGSTERTNQVASCCDGYKSCKHTVESERE